MHAPHLQLPPIISGRNLTPPLLLPSPCSLTCTCRPWWRTPSKELRSRLTERPAAVLRERGGGSREQQHHNRLHPAARPDHKGHVCKARKRLRGYAWLLLGGQQPRDTGGAQCGVYSSLSTAVDVCLQPPQQHKLPLCAQL
jgi:hypothetical protein